MMRLLLTTLALFAAGVFVDASPSAHDQIKNDVDRAFFQYASSRHANADAVPDPRAYLSDKYGEPDEASAHLVTWFNLRGTAELSLWRDAEDAPWSAYRVAYRDGRQFLSVMGSKDSAATEATRARIMKECQRRDITSFHRILAGMNKGNEVVQRQHLDDAAHVSSVHLSARDAPIFIVLDTIAELAGLQVSPPDGVGTRISFDSGDEVVSTDVAFEATIRFLRDRGIRVYTNDLGRLTAAWE